MFCCDDDRDVLKEENNLNNTNNKRKTKNKIDIFEYVETYITNLFNENMTPEQSLNLLNLFIIQSQNNYISLTNISKILIKFKPKNKNILYDIFILPFYILERNINPEINLITESESYNNYFNLNLKLLLFKHLHILQSEENLNDFQFKTNLFYDDNNNKNEKKLIIKINIINIILFFLFYSNINNEIKTEILFNLFNYNIKNEIFIQRKPIYLIIRRMLLISLFFIDIYTNYLMTIKNRKHDFFLKSWNEKEKFFSFIINTNNNNKNKNNSNDNFFEYKVMLFYIKHTKGIIKELVNYLSDYFIFYKNSLNKKEFFDKIKKNNYEIFDVVFFRNLIMKTIYNNNKNIKLIKNFPNFVKLIEEKLSNYNNIINISNNLKLIKIKEACNNETINYNNYYERFAKSRDVFFNVLNSPEYLDYIEKMIIEKKLNNKRFKINGNLNELNTNLIFLNRDKLTAKDDKEDYINSEDNNYNNNNYNNNDNNNININNNDNNIDNDNNFNDDNNINNDDNIDNNDNNKNSNDDDDLFNLEFKNDNLENEEEENDNNENKLIEKDLNDIKKEEELYNLNMSDIVNNQEDIIDNNLNNKKLKSKKNNNENNNNLEKSKLTENEIIDNNEDYYSRKNSDNNENTIEDNINNLLNKKNNNNEESDNNKNPFDKIKNESIENISYNQNNNNNNNINTIESNNLNNIIIKSESNHQNTNNNNQDDLLNFDFSNNDTNSNHNKIFSPKKKIDSFKNKNINNNIINNNIDNNTENNNNIIDNFRYNNNDQKTISGEFPFYTKSSANSEISIISSNNYLTPQHIILSPNIFKLNNLDSKKKNKANNSLKELADIYKDIDSNNNNNNTESNNNEFKINNITLFLINYFSNFENFCLIPVENIKNDLNNLDVSNYDKIYIKKITPYLKIFNVKFLFDIIDNNKFSLNLMNLYLTLMNLYNIFLRNSNKIKNKVRIFNINFFNSIQESINENEIENVYNFYKEDIFDNNNNTFDDDDFIILIPHYIFKDIYMQNEEKFLFISVINNKENTITFLDSNDILTENNEIFNNFKLIYEKFFDSLLEINFIKKKRDFKYQIDNIESLCLNENVSNHIMTYYSRLFCVNGKMHMIEENNYDDVKKELFSQLSMFYIMLSDFIKEEKEKEFYL